MGCQTARSTSFSQSNILVEAKDLYQQIYNKKPLKIFAASLFTIIYLYCFSPLPQNFPVRKDIFLKERIPGYLIFLFIYANSAKFFDLLEVIEKDESFHNPVMMLKDTEKFKSYMKEIDLGFDDMVVLYDDYGMAGAFKAWYILKAFNKSQNVFILNGGFNKWKAEKFQIEEGKLQETIPKRNELDFEKFQFDERFDISEIDLIHLINNNYKTADNKQVQIIDARAENKFIEKEDKNKQASCDLMIYQYTMETMKKGHIKGAINIPYRSLFYEDYTLKNTTDLKEIFCNQIVSYYLFQEKNNINFENKIIPYCLGSVAASCIIFALQQCGAFDVVIYNGGFSQFGHSSANNDNYIEND